jgi:hypothetical protein
MQWLNSALKEENHELCPIGFFLGCILQLLDVIQQWLDFFCFSLRRKGIPGCQSALSGFWLDQMEPIHIHQIQKIYGP